MQRVWHNQRFPLLLSLLVACLTVSLGLAQETDAQPAHKWEYHDAYYVLDELNLGLPTGTSVNLQTPQAALEHFLDAARDGNFALAAQALNLNLLPVESQAGRASGLAERLYYVIDRKIWIDWGSIPDRPDGQIDRATGPDKSMVGKPRRSILFGSVQLDGRDVDLRLQRVRVGDSEPVWMISPQLVEAVPQLYERYGPGLIDRYLPEWGKARFFGNLPIWEWATFILFITLSVLVGFGLQRLITRALKHSDKPWSDGLASAIPKPLSLLLTLVFFHFVSLTMISLSGPVGKIFYPVLGLLIVAALTWLAMRTVSFFTDYVSRKHRKTLEEDDFDPVARRQLTYIMVAKRVVIFIAIVLGAGIALSQFSIFQTLGMSLLASAGVASVILGIAASSVLGNIMAGIQIAITQPINIGDNVYYENDWGYIEEITYTYVTIRTWDQRRVVVPLKYLLSKPIQNWTMQDTYLVKPILLYADYRIDVQKVRDHLSELLDKDDDYDGRKEPTLQVTNCTEETIELRALVSADDPSAAWNLHCRIREQLIRFIQELDDGRYLPHERHFVDQLPE